METLISEYFSDLFSTSHPRDLEMQEVLNSVGGRISEEMNCHFLKPFTESEIYHAVKQIHSHKSSGPDGLSGAFYHRSWRIVGSDVTKRCLSVLNH